MSLCEIVDRKMKGVGIERLPGQILVCCFAEMGVANDHVWIVLSGEINTCMAPDMRVAALSADKVSLCWFNGFYRAIGECSIPG